TRASTQISQDIVTSTIEKAIKSRIGLAQSAQLTVTLAANDLPYHLPPGDSGGLQVVRLDYNTRTGYFRADLRAADGSRSQLQTSFRGQAIETVRIPVLLRDIGRDEIIQAGDIQYRMIARREIITGTMQMDSDVIGMAARRGLQAGRPLRLEDIEPPKLVRRNMPVVIVYQHKGMTLSVRGRAIADGALGELVRVMNIRSNRIVEGIVSGHGRVSIERLAGPVIGTAPQPTTTQLASSQ
ncbi:MAG: flagellar basal body P-ring formation chaperone FlgA, partial [Fimbriimonadaceae bacterium]|nr:flagellar basal body P-ring formation chaperone FlgA [Alphaproteobacteria bacterium]